MEHSDRLMYPKCFFFFFLPKHLLDLRRITINLLLLQNHEEYGQQSQNYVTVNTMRIILNPFFLQTCAVCKTCSYQRAHAVDLTTQRIHFN